MSDQIKFRIREILFWGTMLLMVSILLYIFFLAAYPYKPLRLDSMVVNKDQVCRGGELCFVFKGEKFYPIPADVTVELSNGERYQVMKYTANNPVGTVFRQRCFIVPYHVKPGKYEVIWTGKYEPNAFQSVYIKKKSNWIEVANSMKRLEK
jgi:hypothetical protein